MITSRVIPALRLSLPLPFVLAFSACDKIKQVVDDVKTQVEEQIEERIEDPSDQAEANPLMALVDKNEDGYVFRKDIEFPTELRVVTSYKRKISGRIFNKTELGTKIEAVNGKESVTAEFKRKGPSVVYHLKDTSFELPLPEDAENDKGEPKEPTKVDNPFRQAPPLTKPMTFLLGQSGWKGKGRGDFKLMAMSQQLSPVFGDMLIENALQPRPLWFASDRVKIGDEVTIAGAALPMIIPGKAKGRVTLKLEGIEEVKGHPCGRFSVSGEFSRSNFPNLEGRLLNEEVSIESGELWLSLIFPVILKEKIQTIQTFEPSEGGSTIGRGQGTVDTLVVREWFADIPMPEPEPETETETETEPEAETETSADEAKEPAATEPEA